MIESKRFNRILIAILILAVVFTAVHVYIVTRPAPVLMKWYHVDDAFYYFKVARNVAEGEGFTFDGLGKSNGFHPLWMLINIPIFALARFNTYLPFRVLLLVSATFTFLGGLILFNLLRKQLRPEVALVGMAIWLFYWPIQTVVTLTGMEAGINAFSILCFLWLIQKLDRKRPAAMLLLGLMASGVLFSRLDNVFLALLAGVWLVFYQRPMRDLVLTDILIGFLTIFSSVILRVGAPASLSFLSNSYLILLIALPLKLVTNYLFGLYQWPRAYRPSELLIRAFGATAISSGILTVISWGLIRLNLISNYPRSAALIDAALSLLFLTASRFLLRLFKTPAEKTDLSLKHNGWGWLSRGVLYLLPIGILFGAYLFWNWLTFGTPMPVSGQIKQWWGTLLTIYGRQQKNIWTVLGIVPKSDYDVHPWYLMRNFLYDPLLDRFIENPTQQIQLYVTLNATLTLIYSALAGLIVRKNGSALVKTFRELNLTPLVAACLLQPFFLGVQGYLAIRNWYWLSQMIVSLVLFLMLLDLLIRWLEEKPNVLLIARVLPYGLILALLIMNVHQMTRYFPPQPTEKDTRNYLAATRYLEESTPEGAVIGMTGGGVEGYFIQDRTIVNLDGLINSKEYFDLMKTGEANLYLDKIGLDYVLSSPERLFKTDPYQWYFTDRLGQIGRFSTMTLFVYLPGR